MGMSIRRYAAAQKPLLTEDYRLDGWDQREQIQKTSKIRMSVALVKISGGTLIQGLNSIFRSSKSMARLLQPQLAWRLLEWRDVSHRLLREVNAPKQPRYNMQTICVNAMLEKVKKIFQEEESIRQNREENGNLRRAFSAPVFSEGKIQATPYKSLPEKLGNFSNHPKLPAGKLNDKIQVLHSVFGPSTEMNEWTNLNINITEQSLRVIYLMTFHLTKLEN